MARFKDLIIVQALALCMQAVGVLADSSEASDSAMETVTKWSTSVVIVHWSTDSSAQPTADLIPLPTEETPLDTDIMIPMPMLDAAPESEKEETGKSESGSDSEPKLDADSGLEPNSDTEPLSSKYVPSDTINVNEYVTAASTSSTKEPEMQPTFNPATSTPPQPKVVVTITHTVLAKDMASAVSSMQKPSTPNVNSNTAAVSTDDWKAGMLSSLNKLRSRYGKAALKLDDKLSYVAWAHSNYQNTIQKMTHNDTLTLPVRVDNMGIKWSGIGENVAFGQKNFEQAMEGWTNSEKHFDNMIGEYDIVGFGMVSNYWTQDFVKLKV